MLEEGASPEFKYSKAYEVDNTRDLGDYMNRQTLVISFLDKSVDFDDAGGGDLDNLRDYIGSARIPLNALMDAQTYSDDAMPIRNHLAKQMGTCSVTLSFMPKDMESTALLTMNASERRQNETVNREVIQKITQGFVELDLEDPVNRGLSAVMDYVFYGRKPRVISKDEFITFVTDKLKCALSTKDLHLFFIANPVLAKARGDMISQEQLLDVF